ncbi:RNA-directed DNA polymerase [Luteimonas sp. MC1782]|uniref:reverse transcriptase family protein n=1 Tax=Luteimonas sp. MC1782 TaxID=2760305 RepID=UPI0015FF0167|nr:reverse transcriptase family protein [Luteimonas sp. MC1782]MBB1472606.1 RNA-directed DNA polymerase [Luteimonas sp. MC1782]
MKNPPKRPEYPHRPIGSLDALSAALQISRIELEHVASVTDSQYRLAKPIVKADGSIRQPYDALPLLKNVQRRIQARLLAPVQFPTYLTGSIKGRDARRNAAIHAGAKVVVCEDVASFFPSTSRLLVESIWTGFFGFSPEVAQMLAVLTTKNGSLPQGAVTSSYLANLAFWKKEPILQQQLELNGIAYSRYVDDITISSRRALLNPELSWCIAQIYGMMRGAGMQAKRGKQEIWRGDGRMLATKLVVNRRPALPPNDRKAIRTAVFQLEARFAAGDVEDTFATELNRVAGRVVRLAQFHPVIGAALKGRIASLRQQLSDGQTSAIAP